MIKATKVRLFPSEIQERLMWKSVGVARRTYNFALDLKDNHYRYYRETLKENDIKKIITELKKLDEYKWLSEVSSRIPNQAIRDCDRAYKNYFKGLSKHPKFKSKKKSKNSFYNDNTRLKVKENKLVMLEKIGRIKTNEQIEIGVKYYNPRISYDGKYWYLSVGIEKEYDKQELTDISLGIDLGLKNLAVLSNGTIYKNINKSQKVKKIEKKLKRLQRKVSKKYENNKKGSNYYKTNNIKKIEKQIKLTHRRLANIRNNYLHQITTAIVKTKPSRIVIEDLNVRDMLKNKYLSNQIGKMGFYEFRRQLEYKCKMNGIELVVADRWYPSSKICSCCGLIKKDLKLSDRTYNCECGLSIDRDLNASINLSKYKL